MASIILSDEDRKRFWAKVIKTESGCWFWSGAHFANGYGEMRVSGKKYGTHRISWIIHFDSIPNNLWVLHDCPGGDNRGCVNPQHLWLGTGGDNARDCAIKGRMLTGKIWAACHLAALPRGKDHWKSGISDKNRTLVFQLYKVGWTRRMIAEHFHVTYNLINGMINRERRRRCQLKPALTVS